VSRLFDALAADVVGGARGAQHGQAAAWFWGWALASADAPVCVVADAIWFSPATCRRVWDETGAVVAMQQGAPARLTIPGSTCLGGIESPLGQSADLH
jgi:hypothetical protein